MAVPVARSQRLAVVREENHRPALLHLDLSDDPAAARFPEIDQAGGVAGRYPFAVARDRNGGDIRLNPKADRTQTQARARRQGPAVSVQPLCSGRTGSNTGLDADQRYKT